MIKKVLWLLVSCMMILSLIMASCGTTTEEEEEEALVSTQEPKYGGELTVLSTRDINVFGAAAVLGSGTQQSGYVLEQITNVDRTRGPAGTGEAIYVEGPPSMEFVVGQLAESWETPEIGVWKLKIRRGVYFQNYPEFEAMQMVGGREMNADDIKASIEYIRDHESWAKSFEPQLIINTTVEKTGDWELTVNTPVNPTTGYLWIMGGGGNGYIWPKEILEAYGQSNEWYHQVGTGPYILKEWVPSSAATYIKNDNYWDTDPVGPGKGNQLPYIDTVKYLIVTDLSTRLAALRTGSAEISFEKISREDTETLKKSIPDLQTYATIIEPVHIGGRTDLPDNIFSKLKVRQAMMLAINHPEIVKDRYDGQAEYLDSPARKTYPTVYVPMEEQPEIVQEMFGYNPDKAKQFLAEAGYPEGFKMNLICNSTTAHTEAAELVKSYWEKVGIDINIQVKEPTAWTGIWASFECEDLLLADSIWAGGNAALFVRYSLGYYRDVNAFNISHVNCPPGSDPVIEAAFEKQAANVMINYPAADQAFKDIVPYILEQAFLIQLPAPHGYYVWMPWLKGYYGEFAAKFWLQYAWIDQNLKKSMGY